MPISSRSRRAVARAASTTADSSRARRRSGRAAAPRGRARGPRPPAAPDREGPRGRRRARVPDRALPEAVALARAIKSPRQTPEIKAMVAIPEAGELDRTPLPRLLLELSAT